MNEKRPTIELIAEIGQAHDGSVGILHSYIDALADTGVDTIKFQTHIASAESSLEEPFRINFSYVDKTRFDYWQRMTFDQDTWRSIKNHCEDKGLNFLSSPFSVAAVELLESIGVQRYKIGSGEVTNLLMLHNIAQTRKPIILSSGMSTYRELDEAVRYIIQFHEKISILQCTTSYPTPAEKVGLNVITELKNRYPNFSIGLSEHTATPTTGIAAAALGAELIEFHAVFDRRIFGPDASSSLTIDEIKKLVQAVRAVEKMLGNPVDKSDNSEFGALKNMFEKSLAVNKDKSAGSILRLEDLESKKPSGTGISAKEFKRVLGKTLANSKRKNEFLQEIDLS